MKLRGVIITNRMNLCEFFDFQEFWSKRQEFVDTLQKDVFFGSAHSEPYVLYSVVADWIGGNLKLQMNYNKTRLTPAAVIVKGRSVPRRFSNGCGDALGKLSEPDALGLVALYEMMGRDLSLDIEQVLPVFRIDFIDPKSSFWGVQGGRAHVLPPLDRSQISETMELRNVLIVNTGATGDLDAVVKFGSRELHLSRGECCRAIFCGGCCLHLLPRVFGDLELYLSKPRTSSLRNRAGVPIQNSGSVLSVAAGSGGFVLLTDEKTDPVVARHSKIDDSSINYGLPKDERPVHIAMSPSGRDIYVLTNRRRLYHYPSDIDEVECKDQQVLMVDFIDGKLVITK